MRSIVAAIPAGDFLSEESTAGRRMGCRVWSAIDVAAEAECDLDVARKTPWRRRLMAWLIEFNKY